MPRSRFCCSPAVCLGTESLQGPGQPPSFKSSATAPSFSLGRALPARGPRKPKLRGVASLTYASSPYHTAQAAQRIKNMDSSILAPTWHRLLMPFRQSPKHEPHASASVEARPVSGLTSSKQQEQKQQEQATASTSSKAAKAKVENSPMQTVKCLVSGAVAAIVSRTAMAPLERIKMDQMLKQSTSSARLTAQQVLRTEGILGFWKGNGVNLLRTAPFKALNFASFEAYHKFLGAVLGGGVGADANAQRFLAGAMAGMTATLVCFPLDVVRTRLMAVSMHAGPRYGGPISTLKGMLRHEGPRSLYSGCLPALLAMGPAGAAFYGVFDLLKQTHLDRKAAAAAAADQAQVVTQIEPIYTLMYGALAGAASEFICYPFEVIRRRMQIQSMALAAGRASVGRSALHHAASAAAASAAGAACAASAVPGPGWSRVAATCSAIMRTEGFRGFYVGLLPNMLQVLPSGALSYYSYETVKQALSSL